MLVTHCRVYVSDCLKCVAWNANHFVNYTAHSHGLLNWVVLFSSSRTSLSFKVFAPFFHAIFYITLCLLFTSNWRADVFVDPTSLPTQHPQKVAHSNSSSGQPGTHMRTRRHTQEYTRMHSHTYTYMAFTHAHTNPQLRAWCTVEGSWGHECIQVLSNAMLDLMIDWLQIHCGMSKAHANIRLFG